jgi:precorrin-6x reductase
MQDIDQTIRERAYHLWIESGCEDGNADIHWLTAQREILSASLADTCAKPAKSAKPKRAAAPRKRKAA